LSEGVHYNFPKHKEMLMPKWDAEPETGLLDNYDFTITGARFAPDQTYADGTVTLLQLEGTTSEPDIPTTSIWIPCGKGWQSVDGGKTLVHESTDPDRMFVKSSILYAWVHRMIHEFGMKDALEATGRDDPCRATSWVGLKFHIKRETLNYEGLDSSGPKSLPSQFLGIVGEGSVASAPAPTASAQATETPQEKIARVKAEMAAKANGAGTPSLRDQVVAILKSETDPVQAENKALNLDGVASDDALLMAVMDHDSELWAEAKA
jgi:hypothetical protein